MTKKATPNQDVSTALELVITTLQEELQRIYDAGSVAMTKQDRKTAYAMLEFSQKLEQFQTEVNKLVAQWKEMETMRDAAPPDVQQIVTGEGRLFSGKTRESRSGFTRKVNHPLAPQQKFSILFSDGTRIAEPYAYDTLVKAILKIGIERVYNMDIKCCGEPLVSKTQSIKYPKNSKKAGDYYVLTQSSTKEKIKILQAILKQFSIKAVIEAYNASSPSEKDKE